MIENIFPEIVSEFKIASLVIPITDTLVTTWIIILILTAISYFTTRKLSISHPPKIQIFAERIVIAIEQTLENSVNISAWVLVPFIGTIWIYVGFMNLISLIPYFHNPTRDLSTTAALSVIVFFSIHYYGIKFSGFSGYLKKYIEPSIFLLPFNLFADISRIFAMAIRLFGNMLSWEMIVAILIALVGFLVPVPMILLSIVGDVLHAFLFGLLTYIFIIAGIQVEELKSTKEKKNG
ncbi:F0F1 ATP synthase subunit A [Sulfurovum sp. TSL1]|uniref:F0F1 ATP synthase subunit A n=1 Tax=Sulfurovum sp. TSL1 TaxID=2826994 RepID=UPI001CC43B40|nr:F0F1 ATP synthase subunit A [Sulfurovum sp. TSL1]GIT97852.1 ATP synthase subunit a [Sulfurovum sp. TSL1]